MLAWGLIGVLAVVSIWPLILFAGFLAGLVTVPWAIVRGVFVRGTREGEHHVL